jgi:hypothetical protein
MKAAILSFCVLLSIQAFAETVTDPKDALLVPDPESAVELFTFGSSETSQDKTWVDQGLFKSHAVLSRAIRKSSSQWRSVLQGVRGSLTQATVKWPAAGSNFSYCAKKPTTLAFVILGGSYVFLCRRVFRESWFELEELGQVLIHEAAHVKGYGDECIATRIEIAAMRYSGEGVAFENSYWGPCHLK